MKRRNFLKNSIISAGALGSTAFVGDLIADNRSEKKILPIDEPATNDRDFWRWVRESYTVSDNIINLNNGGVSPQPKVVQDTHNKYYSMSNEAPSYYMWRIIDAGREPLRDNLATLAGVSAEEIAINRNATEGLNTIIFGLNLKKGDEVVLNKYDYPNMMNAWKQREKRDGIKLVWVEMDFPMEDEEEIAKVYIDKFTSKTKIVHITHVINWVGQVLPIQKIAREAHRRGIEVIVDAAHSFAHLDYKIPDLECDYFATSLHKWLSAPFGTGMMYIKKDKISNVWALLSAENPDGDDIRKFESLGTRSFPIELAIGSAISFHNTIGARRKEERLIYLRNYWMKQVLDLKGVSFYNSFLPSFSSALANIKIEGKSGSDLSEFLWNKYKIHTVAIKIEKVDGVRITPNVYTSEDDLDRLVKGISSFVKNG